MGKINADYLAKLRQDLRFEATLRGQTLSFQTTWGLFSPRAIDEGTELLLRHLEVEAQHRSIDLGCGYGPIGLSVAKQHPQGQVVLLDKDYVAVEYANKNTQANGLQNAQARLSNGLSAIDDDGYDRVISNLPAKVGKELVYLFLDDARRLLKPGGEIWLVTINGLRQYIKGSFLEMFGNYDKIKQGRSYTVARAVRQSSCQ